MKPEIFSDVSAVDEENIVWDIDAQTIEKVTFNDKTKFNNQHLADEIIRKGMTPPLGVGKLHKKGITGLGVNVGIIDQPIDTFHPEYKESIGYYMPTLGRRSSMHGPAVTSLLVGKNIGVAPKAKVYYVASPFYERNAKKCALALDNILFMNRTLPLDKRIKFVSVSANLSKYDGYDSWKKAVKKAEEEGVLVVDADSESGFVLPGFMDNSDFKYGCPDYSYNKEGFSGLNSDVFKALDNEYFIAERDIKKQIFAPAARRTIAETNLDGGDYGYTYSANGGLSWAIPYVTGLLCLGSQVAPSLSAFELKDLLIETSVNSVINPEAFIKKAKEIEEELQSNK